jgi:hypothetical protein
LRLLWGCCLAGGFALWTAIPVSAALAEPAAHALPASITSPASGATTAVLASSGGTLQVSPATVTAATPAKLTFTYTAGITRELKGTTLTLSVASGLSAPSSWLGTPSVDSSGCAQTSCVIGQPTVAGDTISVPVSYLPGGSSFQIIDDKAIPPSSPGNYSFIATAYAGTPNIITAPASVAVICGNGAGTISVSPSSVTVSKVSSLTFTYTAAGCGVLAGGEVTVAVPLGWTLPTTSAGLGQTTTSLGTATAANSLITVTGAILTPGQTLTLHYTGAAPSSAGTSTFTTSEESAKGGALAPLSSPPLVTVTPTVTASTPPATPSPTPSTPGHHGGKSAGGTMTVSPGSVPASRASTLTFTFTASHAGLARSGVVALTVPRGWTLPTLRPGTPGYTNASAGTVSVSGRRIRVTRARLAPGHTLTIVYHDATAPAHPSSWEFRARAGSSRAAGVARLAASPVVMVTAATISHAFRLTAPWLIALVVVAGVILASAAALWLRRGPLAPPASVAAIAGRTVPSVTTVRNVGPEASLIVRIEPHDGSSSIRTEELKT